MSDVTTTVAWKMGRNGEQRGDTMGPFEDGTLADTQWRAGFDALAGSEDGPACPSDSYGSAVDCRDCPFIAPGCEQPNPPRHQ